MRLTVHLSGAKKITESVPSKEKPGTYIKKKKLMNTISFNDVTELDLGRCLSYIESNELGTVERYYFSNEKVPGHIRKKK